MTMKSGTEAFKVGLRTQCGHNNAQMMDLPSLIGPMVTLYAMVMLVVVFVRLSFWLSLVGFFPLACFAPCFRRVMSPQC
jgi:hypothetical protein